MNNVELAYIAGIVDGEGYIGLSKFQGKVYGARYKNKYSYKTRFVVTNTDRSLILWLHSKQ